MPYIHARLSISLDDIKKNEIQSKLSDLVSSAFSKPQAYIMSEIVGNCSLFMGGKAIDNGAYISIKLLGHPSKSACSDLTKSICDTLTKDYNINPSSIYITYHPVDLWGWNGMMF